MRYLVVASQLGFLPGGGLVPGGLLQFGRCVARALASAPTVTRLGVWAQVDEAAVARDVARMIQVHAHPALELDVHCFGGSRIRLALAVWRACRQHTYDRVMYLLVNQAVLGLVPWHLPYDAWEIGEELFKPISWHKRRALGRAGRLLSISRNTAQVAARRNPGLPEGQPVLLCLEPPLYEPEPVPDPVVAEPYEPAARRRAVLIVANMHRRLLYKGHQELIAGWSRVVDACPDAELWIVGDGQGRPELETRARMLPSRVANRILFLGRNDAASLDRAYRTCRAFAMPSRGEGFGLVFVEAARYGLPCIGGRHDGVKEIVVHGQTGLLVEQSPEEVAAACVTLLTDDELARRLGNAGRERYLACFQFCHFRERLLDAVGLGVGGSLGLTAVEHL